MGLEALLTRLEGRTVTPALPAVTPDVTASLLPTKGCTAVTPVTAANPLSTTPASINLVDFAERAAMIAANGIPKAWAEGYAALCTMSRPAGYAPDRWQQMVDDGGRFLDRWGKEAAALGWQAVDVFGIRPDALAQRYDGTGLVSLLAGRPVCVISQDAARIDCGGGVIQSFYRSKHRAA